VKKLYHHLYKENALEMDWETPMDALGGKTPLEVAKIGMKEHSSQTGAYAVKSHGTYDNSKFGLYFTTVGQDEAKNDFLEHIDPDASANYLAEHAGEIEARKEADAAELAAAAETAKALPDEPEAGEEAIADEVETSEEMPDDAEDQADEAPVESEDGGTGTDLEEAPAEPAEQAAQAGPAEQTAEAEENGDYIAAQPGLQAEGQPLVAAQPQVTGERNGGSVLPALMIGAGVAAIGVGGWYGWRYMQGQKRRRRRRR